MKIADTIKYEGQRELLVFKHPCEDFNSYTQLIVHEGQEAIFMMNGEIMDILGPGRHTLETQNIPMIAKAYKGLMGGKSPFHSEVYFVNKTVQMGVKWGTDSKIHFIEPTHKIPLELGASGEINLSVIDSKKLLTMVVGTLRKVKWEEEIPKEKTLFEKIFNSNKPMDSIATKSLKDCFRTMISNAVKESLPKVIKDSKIDILDIDSHLADVNKILQNSVEKAVNEYGLSINNFYLSNIALPEDDSAYKKFVEIHSMELKKNFVKAERDVELEKQDTEIEVAKKKVTKSKIENDMTTNKYCHKCGAKLKPDSEFCSSCGTKI